MSTSRSPLLMNPGPVTLSERVRRALVSPDLCHREPEFTELQRAVRSALEHVYASAAGQWSAVLLAGSGTAAVEAMVTSLVPRDAKALVVSNGVYGERMASMLECSGRAFVSVRSEWTRAPDASAVEHALDRDPEIGWVLAVHHETTTGRLNDLSTLGAICARRRVKLLLDAVSSFGAEEIDLAAWNVEACAATANKCLHGAPGVAFVLARRDALLQRTSAARGLYLDLFRHFRAQEEGSPLFTPPVHVLYALREALAELAEAGGWDARRRRYRTLSRLVREGLAARGVRPLLEDDDAYASSLTSFVLPDGVDYHGLHDALKHAGFVVYPGQQSLRGRMFRIAVMGALEPRDLERFLAAFDRATAPRPGGARGTGLQAGASHSTE